MSSEYGTIFRRAKHGDPVSKVCDVDQINAVYSALEDTEGVWCRIERDSKDGKGWRIVIDGSSDIDPPFPAPWANAMPDYPWKVTVANTGTAESPVWRLLMETGRAMELSTGRVHDSITYDNYSLSGSGYLYCTYPLDVRDGSAISVGYAASLPSPAANHAVVPIAQVTINNGTATVLQIQMGLLAIAQSVAEEV